jgi:hypothetical protein
MLLLAGVGIAALATTFIKGKGETEKVSVSPTMKPAARGFFDSAPVPVDPVFAARQSEMFGLAAHATNTVTEAVVILVRLRADAEALFTNDTGRLIARNHELVMQAARLYSEELPKIPTSAELLAKLGNLRRIELLAASASDTNDLHQLELNSAVEQATVFAEQSVQQAYPVRMLLASLIEEAKFRPDTRNNTQENLTLAAVLGRRMQAERISQIERERFEKYMKAAAGK